MLARRSLLTFLNSVLGAGLGYVALFAMARFMGAEVVGARAYALSLVFLAGSITRLGFPTTHARRLGRGEDTGRSVGTYLALKLVLTAAFVLVAVGIGTVWFGILDKPLTDLTMTALWLSLLIVVARSLRDVFVNTFRGLQQIVEREWVLFTNTLVTVVLAVLAAVATAHSHGRWSPVPGVSHAIAGLLGAHAPVTFSQALAWVVGAYLAGEVASLGLAMLIYWGRRIPLARPEKAVVLDYIRGTFPLMVVSFGAVMMKRVDQIMVGFWFDNIELAKYAAAMTLSDLLLILAFAIEVPLMPLISQLHKQGATKRLVEVVQQSERWISLLVWPVMLYVALIPTQIMHILLSDEFLAAAPPFVILCVYTYVLSLRIPLKNKALGIGAHGYAARVSATAVILNIVLNFLFIPPGLGPVPMLGLGAKGAAITTLLTGIYMFLAFRLKAHEWTGYPFWNHHLIRHAGAGLAAWLVLWSLGGVLPAVLRFYDLLWYGVLVLGVYLLALWFVGEIHRGDLRALRDMMGKTPKSGP